MSLNENNAICDNEEETKKKKDLPQIKVLVDKDLILNFLLKENRELNKNSSQIIGLIRTRTIIGYVSSLDLNYIIDVIHIRRNGKLLREEIKERIRYDFKIYEIDEKIISTACNRNDLISNDIINITCLKQGLLNAIVVSDHEKNNQRCSELNEQGINIFTSETFLNWYSNGCILAENSVQKIHAQRNDVVQNLNEIVGRTDTDKYSCYSLRKIVGYSWFFDSFEVFCSERNVITAKIRLLDTKNNLLYTFPATSNGTIKALLLAVDMAVIHLINSKVLEKKLPSLNNVLTFEVSNRSKQADGDVKCKITIEYQDKNYDSEFSHIDTVKAALFAYIKVLKKVLDS
jgi:hypothetical protein